MKPTCLGLFLVICLYSLASAQAPLFREVAVESGLIFKHVTGATGEFFLPEIMGAGVAVFDYDNDGDLDVYLVQGALLGVPNKSVAPSTVAPGSRLFRNELIPAGKLKFTDVTEKAGVGHTGYGMGVCVGDYDNDGDADLYVTCFGANVFFRNNGNGTFSDVTKATGVNDDRWSTSAAFVDYDRDGDLDLYVCNYVDFTVRGNKRCYTPTGELDYCAPASYRAVPDRLFRNEGNSKFTDASQAAGIHTAIGPGLGVTTSDFNSDGWQDIYVANDGAANLLWLNKGDGTFEDTGLMAGAAYSADGVARAGMGVNAGDYDNDGDDDLLVTNLTQQGSTLYRNDGKAIFADASLEAGLSQPSFLSTGFGIGWFDYDNDGWLDLFAANGAVTMLPALRGQVYPFHQRNQLFHNTAGKGFLETTKQGGAALQLSEVSRGAAFGDLDNDGDLDIVVNNNHGPARLLLNQAAKKTARWLAFKLVGTQDNQMGLGARVGMLTSAGWRWRSAQTNGSYLSASDARVYFGLGNTLAVEQIQVRWPTGLVEHWKKPFLNQLTVLRQGSGQPK